MDWVLLGGAGIAATAVMDVIAFIRAKLFGVSGLNYAFVGRWLLNMPRGRFFHHPIMNSAPMRGELALGWVAHYAIGIALSWGLGALIGAERALVPNALVHIGYGLVSVGLPFLIMQPGFGFGVFARKTPNPAQARKSSLIAHGAFGLGLYLACWGIALMR
ncbi:DUF2938 family protein [Tropicibacter sp. R15_0]|uniref:DUF2938 family protein n=1 Tax=Tropicibacter sp. R15_0 TaxID=2821101 RepID=UPI001ADB888F|nr:DUF2938 family protein [Tropicibacter sp. R15_0]